MFTEKTKRNSFVALCEVASQNNWCWNLSCTTCGHGAFKVAFAKLIKGEHPDDQSFWPNGKDNSSLSKEMNNNSNFFRNTIIDDQLNLAKIVSQVNIMDIKSICKFPDWLGYIGLVFEHCYNHEAQKILSDSFLPQFINLIGEDKEVVTYLKTKQENKQLFDTYDLSKIEYSLQGK